jgi:hypothetical protein
MRKFQAAQGVPTQKYAKKPIKVHHQRPHDATSVSLALGNFRIHQMSKKRDSKKIDQHFFFFDGRLSLFLESLLEGTVVGKRDREVLCR